MTVPETLPGTVPEPAPAPISEPLPQPHPRWDMQLRLTDWTRAVAAFGFTERQARFLVEVMIHSGVFVPRQYGTFAGIVHGQKTHDFLKRLVERGYAVPIQVGPLHRGRLFHVRYKAERFMPGDAAHGGGITSNVTSPRRWA